MFFNGLLSFKCHMRTGSYLIVLLLRLILIIDTVESASPLNTRQMCAKLQSMLSFGKYQTSQISSNVTYASRFYAQNYLAYSSVDDLLIFIEPKHQIHVYNAQTIQLLVNLTTHNVVIATSTTSLTSDSRHELYFLYETPTETNLIAFRLCQVRFNLFKSIFEEQFCLETIHIQFDQPDLRVNGFTIKRNHAGTKKSLLFISTDLGLIYTVFDTHLGSIIGESTIMNETLNEGSIVLSSSNVLYYASKQEHLIYEIHIQRDFRLRYGKIIKTNAIKYPFGLITDECNHLYIATRSMILVMYVQNRATIRSVFSKASDLPITLERLNSTTYVYATVRKYAAKTKPLWMFNFLYFTDPEKPAGATRHPAINIDEKLDFNDTKANSYVNPILYPLYYWTSPDTNATKKYVQFTSAIRKPFGLFRKKKRRKPTKLVVPPGQASLTTDGTKYFTRNPFNGQRNTDFSDDSQSNNADENLDFDDNLDLDSPETINQPSNNGSQSTTNLPQDQSVTPFDVTLNDSNDTSTFSSHQTDGITTSISTRAATQTSFDTKSPNRMINIDGNLFSEDEIDTYLQGHGNFSQTQQIQIETYLAKQSSLGYQIFTKSFRMTTVPTKFSSSTNRNTSLEIGGTTFSEDEIESFLEGRSNLTVSQQALIQAYIDQQSSANQTIFPTHWKITKPVTRPPSTIYAHTPTDWKVYLEQFDEIINVNGTTISKDDLRSYLEGRSNLSAIEEKFIQSFLAQQSSSFYNIFSRYFKTTTKAISTLSSSERSFTASPTIDTLTLNENLQLEAYFRYVNDSDNNTGLLFSYEDLKSYLRGNANLSTNQETQIQAYLAKQWTPPYNLSLTSTRKPHATLFPGSGTLSEYGQIENRSTTEATHSVYHTRERTSTDLPGEIDGILFSEDDIQSYLDGRTNLSLVQQAQIQAYLNKQSISSKYSTTTKESVATSESQSRDNLSLTDAVLSEDHLQTLLPTRNQTIDSDEIIFSDDDALRAFLVVRSNLSRNYIDLIEEYLFKRKPLNRTKSRNRTNLPMGTRTSGKRTYPTLLYSTTQSGVSLVSPSFESKNFNVSTPSIEQLFSEDDLKSYLEGRANLSKAQEKQIEAYLSKQLSSPRSPSPQYTASTKRTTRTSTPTRPFHSKSPTTQNRSRINDTRLDNDVDQLSPLDFQFDNRTTDSNGTLFFNNDLRSFLAARSNLSQIDLDRIETYISRRISFNQTKDEKKTTSSSEIYTYDDSTDRDHRKWITQLQNYFTKLPSHMNYFNFSTDSDQLLFSEDDLKSYLQNRANLTRAQEQQIQEYLAKHLPSSYNPFFLYLTSTRGPSRTTIPGRRLPADSQKPRNLSLIDPSLSSNYSEGSLPTTVASNNNIIDSNVAIFSDDDELRTFLQTRSNLSRNDMDMIQTYLSGRKLLNQTSLLTTTSTSKSSRRSSSRYDTTTRSKIRVTTTPLDWKELLFSEDDLNLYLQGRANLSLAQETQIQAYLSQQSSLSYNPFSTQSTTTRQPQRTSKPGGRILPDTERIRNTSSTARTTSRSRSQNLFTTASPLKNRTTDSHQTIFSGDDDLRSFLQVRSNLSKNTIEQIQDYLSRRKFLNQTSSPNTTNLTTRTSVSADQFNSTQSIIHPTQTPFDWKHFNFSTIPEDLPFSEDDLRSYLQDRANLSLTQQEQIQTFLSKYLPSTYSPSLHPSPTTRKPQRTSTSRRRYPPDPHRGTNLSVTDRPASENYTQGLLPSNYESDNGTINFDEKFPFDDDNDLWSYLIAQSNLSRSDLDQIQAYLSGIGLFNQTENRNKTILPTSTSSSSTRAPTARQAEITPSQNYLTKTPIGSKYSNFSTDLGFSEDDLNSYLQGQTNLTVAQQEQIQAYLSKQISSSHSPSLRYPTSTQKLRSTSPPDRRLYSHPPSTDIPFQTDGIAPEDYPFDDYTIDSDESLVFDDDDGLRSFLQAHSNLSTSDLDKIRMYLSGRKPFKPRQTRYQTTLPTGIPTSSSSITTQSQKYFTRSPFELKYFNITNSTEELLFSEEDLKSYLQDRANLSLAQEKQIQDFLAKQILFDHNMFSSDSMSTIRPTLDSDGQSRDDGVDQTRISRFSTQKALPTSMGSISLDKSSEPALSRDPSVINADYTSEFILDSLDTTISMVPLMTVRDPSTATTERDQTSIITATMETSLGLSTDQIVTVLADHLNQSSTLVTDKTTILSSLDDDAHSSTSDDTTNQSSSSPLSVTSDISFTTHPTLLSTISSTTLPITHLSQSSTLSHFSSDFPSTESSEYTSLSSSTLISDSERSTTITSLSSETTLTESEPTTIFSSSTSFPSYTDLLESSPQFSSMQTTDLTITSDTPKRKSPTTPFETSSTSFRFTTRRSRTRATMSSRSTFTTNEPTSSTKFDQYTSTFLATRAPTSAILSTLAYSTNLDLTTEDTSSPSIQTTLDEENRAESFVETTGARILSTMITPILTETPQEQFTSTELPSTRLPQHSKFKTLTTIESTTLVTTSRSQESTLPVIQDKIPVLTTSTTTITTTTSRQRSRRPKTTTIPTQPSSTSTATISNRRSRISTPVSTWPSNWNPFDRQGKQTDIEPPTASTESNLVLTNDLLNQIFNNVSTTNNSSEKTVFINLVNHPPSTWNLSLNSNESVILDVVLPTPIYSPYYNTTTNLTFTNIEANRFATTITGIPIHLQVDRVQTRQFSLTMNATDDKNRGNQTIRHSSDVIIGHVRSEQFELNLTKSDSMHVHVQQVDSETAELYLDSNFCTNESSLEINLNLSKNGTIRYGNRRPIHIGAVFTRVHMMKQSCDREQPLTLFFDICERENPCLNGGKCQSIFPDYNDPLYIPSESGHVGYKCQCPIHSFGEHCQHSEYPLGYCLNGGTLFQLIDPLNRTLEQCICTMGFRGKHCDENIDNCVGVTCSDHGVCEDGIETYKCSCFDGFYGFHCERSNVQAILLRAASRSFGVIAILLIASIAGLVVASDIHTYLTRKQQRLDLLKKMPRVTSELFENSVLLLGFSDAPMELNDLSNAKRQGKAMGRKGRPPKKSTRNRRSANY